MKLRRKRIVLFAGIAVVACAAGFLLLPESTFNDDDLKPVRAGLDESDNAFAIIEKARGQLLWADEAEIRQAADMAEGNPRVSWDPALAEKLLARNPGALSLLDDVLSRRGLEVPTPRGFDETYPGLDRLWRLSALASIRAEVLFREGREQEAFDLAFKIVELGRRIQAAGGESYYYTRGLSTKKLGLNRIRLMAARTSLPAETLLTFVKRLDHYRADTAALTNVFKTDYQLNVRMIEDLAEGKLPGTNAPTPSIRFDVVPGVLKLTTTKRLFADCTRVCMKSLSYPYARMPRNEVPKASRSRLALMLGRNFVGEMMYDVTGGHTVGLLRDKCHENVLLAATQLVLALKCWTLRHGTLPQSLTALVPDYLVEIPRDDWEGQPFRYSVERRLIYSVSSDLADNGGKAFDDSVFEMGF